jgi:hypothetical protein
VWVIKPYHQRGRVIQEDRWQMKADSAGCRLFERESISRPDLELPARSIRLRNILPSTWMNRNPVKPLIVFTNDGIGSMQPMRLFR